MRSTFNAGREADGSDHSSTSDDGEASSNAAIEELRDACLHELFEDQARRTPDAPAVVDERGETSYRELDRKADLLAAYLRQEGIGLDDVVGVYLERRAEFVVACLAALKAGGAFLPLELAYPPSLLEDVLEDSEPRVVVTQGDLIERLPEGQTLFCLDEGWEDSLEDNVGADSQDGPRPGPDNLVFVAYSSGTTGKPKGIANPHRAAVGSYLWRFGLSDYGPEDRVACGVFFIWEVFRPLLRGATSYVIPDAVIYDPGALVGYLEENGITETLMTPSLLDAVLDAGGPDVAEGIEDLRTLWLNGEVVTKNLARRALRALPDARLFNLYSVSECHEAAAGDLRELVESSGSTHCPVGKPADPDRTYVLDGDANPVSAGTPGKLYVGGDLLARGYVKLPEKTAERFLPDPFAPEEGGRMYRTGDKARLLRDGNLEILGRADSMVKIRGYSIELGAVEAAILDGLAVEACAVVAEGEEGEDKRLVAYLVPASDPDDDSRRLDRRPRDGAQPGGATRAAGGVAALHDPGHLRRGRDPAPAGHLGQGGPEEASAAPTPHRAHGLRSRRILPLPRRSPLGEEKSYLPACGSMFWASKRTTCAPRTTSSTSAGTPWRRPSSSASSRTPSAPASRCPNFSRGRPSKVLATR